MPKLDRALCLLTAGLAGLVVMYALSVGPVCWLCDHCDVPPTKAIAVYRPIFMLAVRNPNSIRPAVRWWCSLGSPPGESRCWDFGFFREAIAWRELRWRRLETSGLLDSLDEQEIGSFHFPDDL